MLIHMQPSMHASVVNANTSHVCVHCWTEEGEIKDNVQTHYYSYWHNRSVSPVSKALYMSDFNYVS